VSDIVLNARLPMALSLPLKRLGTPCWQLGAENYIRLELFEKGRGQELLVLSALCRRCEARLSERSSS
jgi:hypothetical protein